MAWTFSSPFLCVTLRTVKLELLVTHRSAKPIRVASSNLESPKDLTHMRLCSCRVVGQLLRESFYKADRHTSVCFISVIRIVVLSRLKDVDLTCVYRCSPYFFTD